MGTKQENHHLTLLESKGRIRLMPYAQKLLDETLFCSVIDEIKDLYGIKEIVSFRSTQTAVNFSLVFLCNEQRVCVKYVMETTYERQLLHIGFEGRDIPEELRVAGSNVLRSVWEKLRFYYADKTPMFGDYFILDMEAYKKRLEESYIQKKVSVWKECYKQAIKESRYREMGWDDEGSTFQMYVTGMDGKKMLDALEKEGVLTVKQCAENLYQTDFRESASSLQQDRKRKVKFVEKMKGQGYNMWMQEQYM